MLSILLALAVWLPAVVNVGGRAEAPEDWRTHIDAVHGFSIRYPRGFVVQAQDASKYARVEPRPIASTVFMNPTMASGDLAGVEPADLSIRVYDAGAAVSLKNWLRAAGVAFANGGETVRRYRNAATDGFRVCASTLSAPGCSVYVLHNGHVYELTPISQEGERMIETFAPLAGGAGRE